MIDSDGDMRLMVPPLSDDVLMLIDRATVANERDCLSFVRDVGHALRYCISTEVLQEVFGIREHPGRA